MKLLFSLHLQYKSQLTLHYTIDCKKEIILFFGLLYNIASHHILSVQPPKQTLNLVSLSLCHCRVPCALTIANVPNWIFIRKEKFCQKLTLLSPNINSSTGEKMWLPFFLNQGFHFLSSPIKVSQTSFICLSPTERGCQGKGGLLFGPQNLTTFPLSCFSNSPSFLYRCSKA